MRIYEIPAFVRCGRTVKPRFVISEENNAFKGSYIEGENAVVFTGSTAQEVLEKFIDASRSLFFASLESFEMRWMSSSIALGYDDPRILERLRPSGPKGLTFSKYRLRLFRYFQSPKFSTLKKLSKNLGEDLIVQATMEKYLDLLSRLVPDADMTNYWSAKYLIRQKIALEEEWRENKPSPEDLEKQAAELTRQMKREASVFCTYL